jgi:transposase
LLLRQRTQLINAVRGHLAEFGLIARRGARNIRELAELVGNTTQDRLPDAARAMLILLLEQIREAQVRVRQTESALEAWAKTVGCLQATDVDTGSGHHVRDRSRPHNG